MVSTPKIVGLMSCGFLLCFGLSTPALAADGTHQRQQDGPRLGGQSGQPDAAPENEAAKEVQPSHQRQKDGPRVGGQGSQGEAGADNQTLKKAQPSHQRQKDGPRVGGQGSQ